MSVFTRFSFYPGAKREGYKNKNDIGRMLPYITITSKVLGINEALPYTEALYLLKELKHALKQAEYMADEHRAFDRGMDHATSITKERRKKKGS